jgi:hypothetical protein
MATAKNTLGPGLFWPQPLESRDGFFLQFLARAWRQNMDVLTMT